MRIRVNETVTGNDLAQTLEGDQGTYLVQQAGRTYLVTAEPGHSISSMKPVGISEQVTIPHGSNPGFAITKLSQSVMQESAWQGQEREHARN